MTSDKSLLMDTALSPSHLKHITYIDKGKSKVLGLGRVAISKDRHMDKVMLVESLGFNLMSVSMLCDLGMLSSLENIVALCSWNLTIPKSSKALGKETCILLISLQDHSLPHVYLQKLQNAGYGIDDLVILG